MNRPAGMTTISGPDLGSYVQALGSRWGRGVGLVCSVGASSAWKSGSICCACFLESEPDSPWVVTAALWAYAGCGIAPSNISRGSVVSNRDKGWLLSNLLRCRCSIKHRTQFPRKKRERDVRSHLLAPPRPPCLTIWPPHPVQDRDKGPWTPAARPLLLILSCPFMVLKDIFRHGLTRINTDEKENILYLLPRIIALVFQ